MKPLLNIGDRVRTKTDKRRGTIISNREDKGKAYYMVEFEEKMNFGGMRLIYEEPVPESELFIANGEEEKEMDKKKLVGKRAVSEDWGTGTIIGVCKNIDRLLVEFDKERVELHEGNGACHKVWGKNKGRDYHCWWCDMGELRFLKNEELSYKDAVDLIMRNRIMEKNPEFKKAFEIVLNKKESSKLPKGVSITQTQGGADNGNN